MKKITIKTFTLLASVCAALLLTTGCDKNESSTTPPDDLPPITQKKDLTGTSWKLNGVVDAEAGKLTELEPKDCEECYTLTFDDENTVYSFTSANSLTGKYEVDFKTYTFSITTLGSPKLGERGDGNSYRYVLPTVQSFSLQEGELRLYYNEKKEYLSYKVREDIKNPLPDLPWLKEIIDGFEKDAEAGYKQHARIYQCSYRDGIGFLLELCVNCPDFGYWLKSCEGESLCVMWGIAGDSCTEFDVDFKNKELIWEINNQNSKQRGGIIENLEIKTLNRTQL